MSPRVCRLSCCSSVTLLTYTPALTQQKLVRQPPCTASSHYDTTHFSANKFSVHSFAPDEHCTTNA